MCHDDELIITSITSCSITIVTILYITTIILHTKDKNAGGVVVR